VLRLQPHRLLDYYVEPENGSTAIALLKKQGGNIMSGKIEIKGLQKMCLSDYPGKTSAVVFLGSCNFRCPYCFNPDLVLRPENIATIPQDEFFSFLESRKGWLDAVVVGGGEPTIHKSLPDFLRKTKSLGFLTALQTNGSNPEMLEQLIDKKLLDYIAMDLKAPLEKYSKAAGVKADIEKIKESISLIISSGIDHEFRSTLLPALHSKEDIVSMAKLIKGARVYYLQQFKPEKTLNPSLDRHAFPDKELEAFKKSCSKYVKTELRI